MNNRLRQSYLSAMGIPCWQLKSSPALFEDICSEPGDVDLNPVSTGTNSSKIIESAPVDDSQDHLTTTVVTPEVPAVIDKQSLLSEPVFQPAVKEPVSKETQPSESGNVAEKLNGANLSELTQTIIDCPLCPDRVSRQNALPGQGKVDAPLFIISESPNVDEDRTGKYLTGQTENLFKAMFDAVNLSNDYFFTGLVKCFSMEQFTLNEDDVKNCSSFLHQQLALVNPSVVVIFGVAQAQTLLHTDESFAKLRGKIHKLSINQVEYPVIVTYHPAFLIRNPLFKKEALEDLIRIKSLVK